jgi:carbonic anhydrase
MKSQFASFLLSHDSSKPGRMILLLFLLVVPMLVKGQDDLFNYDSTRNWEDGTDYGPREWDQVECDDVETCYGWPEKWPLAVGWSLRRNDCENCEPGDNCDSHHQSPVPLDRQWGKRKQLGDIGVMNCGDNHWMKYESGTCNWEHLKAADAVTVERHALRISQPVEKTDGNDYQLACLTQGRGRIFSRLDMSGGFSQWWWLNHVEIHVPSEHTQNGKRYAAEVHMGHFYSAPPGTDNGSGNRMATVGIFLDPRDNVEPYPFLDKLICQWRASEDNVRKDCGLGSVTTQYPGCFPHNREGPTSPFRQDGRRHLNETSQAKPARNPKLRRSPIDLHAAPEEQEARLKIDPRNYRDAEWTEEQWAKFQEEYSRLHPLNSTNPFNNGRRHLMNYDHVPYFNHQFLLDCRTEYYFRYEGTMTYPPCFTESNSERVNVWRFMKDPIKVHPRQIEEMHRLLRERIAPLGSYNGSPKECTPDTAAKIYENGTVSVARPLQELDESGPGSNGHDNYFCECDDWGSKIPEEREWCRKYRNDDEIRYVTNPYNDDAFNGI